MRIVGGCLLVLLLGVGAMSVCEEINSRRFGGGFGWPIAGTLYFLGYFFILLPRCACKVYRQQKSLHAAISLDFDETGVRFSSEKGQGQVSWKDIHKWKMNARILLLYHSDALFQLVPPAALSRTERDRLVSLVSAKVGAEGV